MGYTAVLHQIQGYLWGRCGLMCEIDYGGVLDIYNGMLCCNEPSIVYPHC
jgi:hypothetical protein